MKTIKITNITNQPGKHISILDLYGQCILPGDFIFIPEIAIDEKVLAHERIGHISIGEQKIKPGPSQVEILKKVTAKEASLVVTEKVSEKPVIEPIKKKREK